MNAEQIKLTVDFLKRVPLRGEEDEAFNYVMSGLASLHAEQSAVKNSEPQEAAPAP